MKLLKSAVLGTAFSLLAFVTAAAEPLRGTWTVQPSKQDGMVNFEVSYRDDDDHSRMGSDFPVNALAGMDLATPGRHDVKFSIDREAGRIDGEGFVKDGEGAGTFRYAPSAEFPRAMARLGFEGIGGHLQFAMTLHDVTQQFARSMQAEKLTGLDTEKLLALRIFEVTPAVIHELRAVGLAATSADTLVAFRVHGVTPQAVREFRKNGFELSEEQLIAFRVHEITPEYVASIESMGLGRPDADQVIALRVHGVTPDYMARMKSRGLENLTLDQLVQLKVHDID